VRCGRGGPGRASSWGSRLRRQFSACRLVAVDEVADVDAAGGAARVKPLLRGLDGSPVFMAHSLVQQRGRLLP
jgi:hypothetical protein